MKSKRSKKDRARRRKPFVSCSAMAAIRFDEALALYSKLERIENLKVFDNPDFQFKIRPADFVSLVLNKENIEMEEFFTEMINIFKTSMGIPID